MTGGAHDAALAPWEALARPDAAPLLDALRGTGDSPPPSLIERLRRGHDPATVNAAISLSAARTRARAKFGARAETLWCLPAHVEMATSPAVARLKAMRFRRAGAARIDDLCCGIGGDLLELAQACEATGADLDPVAAWMAARNTGARTRVADAVAEPGDAPFAHADPARRAGAARIVRGEDLLPPLDVLLGTLRARKGSAVKLGPGMDIAADDLDADDELEFIAERGTLVQQVLWTGALAEHRGGRTATRACTGETISGPATEIPCASTRMRRTLLVPDPALERSRLAGLLAREIGAFDAAPGLGILTLDSTDPLPPRAAAWFERFEVVEELPARTRTVASWLAERGAGIVTVRTRGGACDPDEWQRALRGRGDVGWTVFVLRMGSEHRAYAVRRATSA